MPPTITCPAVNTTTGAQNLTAVNFMANIVTTDNVAVNGVPNCTKNSGSLFSLGTTKVNCSISDLKGNWAHCNFSVTLVDNYAPTVHCVQVEYVARIPAGVQAATVDWVAPTATDNADASPSTVCKINNTVVSPASASSFGFGNTVINCSSTDAAGNTVRLT